MSETADDEGGDKDDLAREVGGLVRARRVGSGLSLAELGRRAGVSGPFRVSGVQ